MAPTLKDDVLLRAALVDNISTAEYKLKLAEQAAQRLGYSAVAHELKRIHREVIVGVEDMIYSAEVEAAKLSG